MTKFRPTWVSNVALAARSDTDQVWSPTTPSTPTPPHPVPADPAPTLEGLHAGTGVWTEVAVDALRASAPLAGTVSEHGLQVSDNIASGANGQEASRTTVWQRLPREGPDNTVG